MKNTTKHLLIEQTDRKLAHYSSLAEVTLPSKGWLSTIRKSLNMTLQQLGNRLSVSPQNVKDLEAREASGNISINRLREAGNALGMKFVYGFIPIDGSIHEMIEKRAMAIASEIVMRTSNSMKLEDQENSQERIKKAINDKAAEIKDELPKYIWE